MMGNGKGKGERSVHRQDGFRGAFLMHTYMHGFIEFVRYLYLWTDFRVGRWVSTMAYTSCRDGILRSCLHGLDEHEHRHL